MNNLEKIQNDLQTIKVELFKQFNINSIALFGSIVRDDFVYGKSDIDIIVDFTCPVGIEFIMLADYLESHLCHKIDLISRNGVKPKYLTEIEKELIYV